MDKFVDLERNEDQVFFINIIIKSRVIPDKYPFIQNIEFVRDIKDIEIYIYVDLIVDFQKYAEFTKKPIEPFWESLVKKGDKLSFGSMTSIFNIKYMDYFIDLKRDIQTDLNILYQSVVPPEFQIKWKTGNYEYVSEFYISEIRNF